MQNKPDTGVQDTQGSDPEQIEVSMKHCRLLILLSCLLLYGTQGYAETLKVGLEKHYPPFSYQNDQGEWVGFDHDLALALCTTMHVSCELSYFEFPELFQALRERSIDIIWSGLAQNEERAQYMLFSNAYYRSRSVYIGKPGLVVSPQTMQGKRVGTEKASIQSVQLRQDLEGIVHIVEGSFAEISTWVAQDKLDAIFLDGFTAYEFLKTPSGEHLDILAEKNLPEQKTESGHIGIRKDRPDLVQRINAALDSLRINNTYDTINRTYFPYSIY